MAFEGYTQETLDFLWGIRFNNERSWFLAHKQDYEAHLLAPTRALGEQVYEALHAAFPKEPFLLKLSRIYRDARRLYGRGPYKSHLWFSLRMSGENWAEQPVFWFEIYPAGYAYGLGIYEARPALMAKFRKAMDEHPEDMLPLANAFQRQTRFRLGAEEYKRPKGTAQPPLDQWYNRKSLDLTCDREIDDLLYSRALVDELLQAYEALMPYYRYFSRICSQGE